MNTDYRHLRLNCKPQMSCLSNYDVRVRKTLKELLSDNMSRLMGDGPGKTSQAEVGRRSGIPQRTVGRIKNGEGAVTLVKLEKLATGFRLKPWQLLVEDIQPEKPPSLGHAEALPPDQRALLDAYVKVSPESRMAVQNFLHAISRRVVRNLVQEFEYPGPERRTKSTDH